MEKKKNKPSQEFSEKKELIELRLEQEKEIHKMRMKELEMIRANERNKHEWAMERNRIKSAEIRKTMMGKGRW